MRSNRVAGHDKERGKYRLGKRSRGDGITGAEQNAHLDLSDVRGLKLIDRTGKTSCACGTQCSVGTTARAVDPFNSEIYETRRHHDEKTLGDPGLVLAVHPTENCQ